MAAVPLGKAPAGMPMHPALFRAGGQNGGGTDPKAVVNPG